ncbi:MAG: nucleoside hydrolase [Micavibrio aeruginosavorus]|nr:nucleoside hydrolase [Micavibrio aeruginosavorus]
MTASKIIIDTDSGADDALALLLLLGKAGMDILAVTTVAGNSTIENVTRNACAILDLAKRRDIPVHSGEAGPIARPLAKAVIHGEHGIAGIDMRATRYDLDTLAADKIVEIVRANPGEIRLLAIGPLSNIASAFQKDPQLPGLIRDIVIMGGAIDVCGNMSRMAEFNFFIDPEAADIVLRAPLKKTLIPLDPCMSNALPLDFFESLKGAPLHGPMTAMMAHFIDEMAQKRGAKGALVYDAIAAFYLIDPAAFTLVDMDIVVETRGEHTAGMSIAEKRPQEPQTPNVSVAMAVDPERFKKARAAALLRAGSG